MAGGSLRERDGLRPPRETIVLFGGQTNTASNDTWEWDGTRWEEKKPAIKPIGRRLHGLVYDEARERVVLFGGDSGGTSQSDLWEWDGSTWERRFPDPPNQVPGGRSSHLLAYDSARGTVVLYGGIGFTYLSDTWEWNGTSWRNTTPALSPPVRYQSALAYDGARRRVVLIGGFMSGTNRNDMWEYYAFGNACSNDDGCNIGQCVDGVCCQSACGGGDPDDCMACSVAAGAEKDGVCGPSTGNACNDDDACTETDTCQAGTCVGTPVTCRDPEACETSLGCDRVQGCLYEPKEAGTVCRDASCEDGEATAEGTCDGTSATCPEPVVTSCGLYVCGADACLGACTTGDDCVTGAYCDGTECKAQKENAEACSGNDECLSGHCVDGVCCDSACDGQCQACDIAGSVGTCSLVTSGQPHGDRTACAGSGACQGSCDGTSATECAFPGGDVTCEASCTGGKAAHAACDGAGA